MDIKINNAIGICYLLGLILRSYGLFNFRFCIFWMHYYRVWVTFYSVSINNYFLYVILATGQALAIGLALTVAIMVGGKISGGNFNPAVSVMMAAAGKLSMKDLLPYIVAQVAGGLAALELHKRVRL